MDKEPVEFDCEGCGQHVVALGISTVPFHQLCSVCAWLCEHVADPQEIERIRRSHGHYLSRR